MVLAHRSRRTGSNSSGLGEIKGKTDGPPLVSLRDRALSDGFASFVVLGFGRRSAASCSRGASGRGASFVARAPFAFAVVPIILYGDPRYRVPAEPLFVVLRSGGRAPPSKGEGKTTAMSDDVANAVSSVGSAR